MHGVDGNAGEAETMKMKRTGGFAAWAMAMAVAASADHYGETRARAEKLAKDSNGKEAVEVYRQFLFKPDIDPRQVPVDFEQALRSLQQAELWGEWDDLCEKTVAAHPENWRALLAVARAYGGDFGRQPWGVIVAGKFERGPHRGGGRHASCAERDRVRALQLFQQGMPLAARDPDRFQAADFHLHFARALMSGRGYDAAWELQALTDLSKLPDYEEMPGPWWWDGRRGGEGRGAPVDENGAPLYYRAPASWDTAANDGGRWRWLLERAVAIEPGQRRSVRRMFANFLRSQFGVQTMAEYGFFFNRVPAEESDTRKDESGTWELHRLADNETIAKLATGIRRFRLPEEFDFIGIYRELEDYDQLARLYADRRQYPQAAQWWRRAIERDGPGDKEWRRKELSQIVDPWGRFEPTAARAAPGGGAGQPVLDYRFRNGRRVTFTARVVDVERLLADAKAHFKSNPVQPDWRVMNLEDIGDRLIDKDHGRYVGGAAAEWSVDLRPLAQHFDRRITVTAPLAKPGAYFVTARMEGGNENHVVLWVADTVIVEKNLAYNELKTAGPKLYFVADARTGAPVAGAKLEFFTWWGEPLERREGHRYQNHRTTEFSDVSDGDGLCVPPMEKLRPNGKQWPQALITATTPEGRFAFLGFQQVWVNDQYDAEYRALRAYGITDRPVYRPGQEVKFKVWIREAKYDLPENSAHAGRTFTVILRNPKGDEILKKEYRADAYAGIDGTWTVPADAPLGAFHLEVEGSGLGRCSAVGFRVEEYKKPEFEVTVDAPAEPVMLGERIPATVKAKYYFGAPVTRATVKYKVERSALYSHWYAPMPWDWFYGPGYWWFACDYFWYPGWTIWGCPRPYPWWRPMPSTPPEIVMENEAPVGEDGTVKIEVDTAAAKAMFGDLDHEYKITAEVRDESRRTIVGSGKVMVARKPFKVYAWIDRGYCRVGDTIGASFAARTLDGKPVSGKGKLTLYRIRYAARRPIETPVQRWDLDTDVQGQGHQQIKASEAGQYRLAFRVTDSKGHEIEGGYVFVIRGEDGGGDFRFNDLELTPDRREYAAGDNVRLLVSTDQPGSTVLLFARAANGVCPLPKVLRLKGRSELAEISVATKDMPNFFVEAVTVGGGRVHVETREIVVPPEKRVLNVDVRPSKEKYRPGERAQVRIRLTDLEGRPFVGSTVVAVYDRSVEYISGGSNVPEIKEFFWKWRRRHHPQTDHSLLRGCGPLTRPKELAMRALGVFGEGVADEEELYDLGRSGIFTGMGGGSGAWGGAKARGARMAMAKPGAVTELAAAAPAAPMMADLSVENAQPASAVADPSGGGQPLAEAVVRTEFADTAFWTASLETDAGGEATVEFKMPENLTGWKIRTWAMAHGTRCGEGAGEAVTAKNLMLRLQAPRFFVEKDEVVLSANVHNYLERDKSVTAVLELEGGCLEAMAAGGAAKRVVTIKAGGEARVDWRVKALREGAAVVRMKALTDEESDAMRMEFPVKVHGMLKTESWSGVVRPDAARAALEIRMPAERRPEQTRLEIRYSPTLAGAMVDALPYLLDYPYGCTEQTLNRFLPAALTQKILKDMGLDLDAIGAKRTNLNAQEIGTDAERAKQWKRYDRDPVFDAAEMEKIVRTGVKDLAAMQLADGGWGWFSGWGEHSGAHTTAWVVRGLLVARRNGVAVADDVLRRGIEWLKTYQAEQIAEIRDEKRGKDKADALDALVYMVLADTAGIAGDKRAFEEAAMREFLYRDRGDLPVYGKALFAMGLDLLRHAEQRDMLIRNIEQFLVEDAENQTAYLRVDSGGFWWWWYGSEYEAQAFYLKLLCRTAPKSPRAAGLVKYLLNNRKHATYWNSTRDTGLCLEAMADYLRASGEDRPDMTVEIVVDGQVRKTARIAADNLFDFDNALVLEGAALTDGPHSIEIRRSGRGPVYFNAYLANFTLEDPITKAGLEIKVDRTFYRLVRAEKTGRAQGTRGQVVDQKLEKFERVPLAGPGEVKSGDLVEVELELESKNDYEYLVFEDLKPAGFEPVEVRSGYTGNDIGAYVEFRDDRVAFFARTLARGRHSVAYRVRAETPGFFSALPARGSAMYAPELKANSDEWKVRVDD